MHVRNREDEYLGIRGCVDNRIGEAIQTAPANFLIQRMPSVRVLPNQIKNLQGFEQKGFAHLLVGLFGAVRNPLAHAPKTNWPMSEQDALDILTLVSLIHRKLDRTLKANTAAL